MDTISPERRSENMRRIRGKDTEPELIVRRALFAMGYRYRLHGAKLPGKPDLVFAKQRKVIFVHGCFWHNHTRPGCKIARLPKSNPDYWLDKLNKNVARDVLRRAELKKAGWKTLVIWECQTRSIAAQMRRINRFLEEI
ncbi:MAG TPA: DNA mismatch endonuclease Vsr [Terriglobales bacterium]|jgi:DNA mismatch endonuclease (patch repair protein)|nr:DNA mismatch endonuclease Vsr [Terriglobales bacterium]